MLDKTIVDVPAIRVGAVPRFQTVPVPANVHIPEPIFRVLAVLWITDNLVTLYVAASKVPLVSVSELADPDNASARVIVPVTLLMMIGAAISAPLLVIVFDPLPKKFKPTDVPQVIPVPFNKLP